MMTLIVYWKGQRKQQDLQVLGVDFDPSGTFWYYTEDPNIRTEVRPSQYHWARIV